MDVRNVGLGGGGAYLEAPGDTASGEPAPSVERAAELMVEADTEQRRSQREAARATAEAAHAARQRAIAELRAAADDVWSSAIAQACIGGAVAVAQSVAVGLGGGAGAAGEAAGAGQAAASTVGDAAATGLKIGAAALAEAEPVIDVWSDRAELHRIGAQEVGDEAQTAGGEEQRLWSDAEASRAARGSHLEAAGRAVDLVEQGRLIAIGRESG